jgi:hypothetical protein
VDPPETVGICSYAWKVNQAPESLKVMRGWLVMFVTFFLIFTILSITGDYVTNSMTMTAAWVISGALAIACVLTHFARVRM